MSEVKFAVQPAGRARVLREKRKNVHAFVRGNVEEVGWLPEHKRTGGRAAWLMKDIMDDPTMVEVTYNPYKFDSFVVKNTLTPVTSAGMVFIYGKNIYAVGVQ